MKRAPSAVRKGASLMLVRESRCPSAYGVVVSVVSVGRVVAYRGVDARIESVAREPTTSIDEVCRLACMPGFVAIMRAV